MITAAPRSESNRAAAKPMPRVAPVMRMMGFTIDEAVGGNHQQVPQACTNPQALRRQSDRGEHAPLAPRERYRLAHGMRLPLGILSAIMSFLITFAALVAGIALIVGVIGLIARR